jgi:alpha-L-arabinofuranosidase
MRRLLAIFLFIATLTDARADQSIYSDQLDSGWENWSWASVNLSNTSPVNGGTRSAAVTTAPWQAIYLHHSSFDTTSFQTLRFWIHGGAVGGQRVQVQGILSGAAQPGVQLAPLTAGSWRLVEISLSSLGVADKPNFDGFWIQDITGTSQPTWYLDDAALISIPPPQSLTITVNAAQLGRTVDTRMFGVNAAVWDSAFATQATIDLLNQAGNTTLRFPGGSLSDDYHWQTNTTGTNTWEWATSFDEFAAVALGNSAEVFITANYGTGTPAEAAAWVQYANVTRGYGFKYWEIGNENYGSWEADNRPRPHDAYVYATEAQQYIQQMKAKDPTIKIGVVAITGEDSYANYPDRVVVNPRTGQSHSGWTPVMLARLKQLGVTPDYIIYHRYPQGPFGESDEGLLGSSGTWADDVADLRQQLDDYLGAGPAANVQIVCTENNSVYSNPGKQTTSLVNGLFLADSICQAMKTELRSLVWWDMRNAQETGNNNSSSLYGWRMYGDYGIVSGNNDRYPSYYVKKLMQHFVRGGDTMASASTNYSKLSAYAMRRTNGTLAVLVLNKDRTTAFTPTISISGFTPASSATVYSYGIPQDEAARTGSGSPDVQQSTANGLSSSFAYTFGPYSATVFLFIPVVGSPPSSPSKLVARALSSSQIQLSWADTSHNETGFKIERLAGATWTEIVTVGPNKTGHTDGGLQNNTTYSYRVRSYNAAGNSGYTNVASARTRP